MYGSGQALGSNGSDVSGLHEILRKIFSPDICKTWSTSTLVELVKGGGVYVAVSRTMVAPH